MRTHEEIYKKSVLEAVEDYHEYLRQLGFDETVEVEQIPRHSFTAEKLQFLSSKELSELSKVVLLGGEPKSFTKKKKINVKEYLYSTFWNDRKVPEIQIVGGKKFNLSSLKNKHVLLQTQNAAVKDSTFRKPLALVYHSRKSETKLLGNDSRSKTVLIPNKNPIQSTCGDQLLTNIVKKPIEVAKEDDTILTTSTNSLINDLSNQEHSEQFYSARNNHPDLEGTDTSTPRSFSNSTFNQKTEVSTISNINQTFQPNNSKMNNGYWEYGRVARKHLKDKLNEFDGETNNNLSEDKSAEHSRSKNKNKITKPINSELSSVSDPLGFTEISLENSSVPINNDQNALLQMTPKPVSLTVQQMNIIKASPKYSPIKNHINEVTDYALHKLRSEFSDLFFNEDRLEIQSPSQLSKKVVLMTEKVLVMTKVADNLTKAVSKLSDLKHIDMRVLDPWKEYLVIASTTIRESKNVSNIHLEFYKISERLNGSIELNNKVISNELEMGFFLTSNCAVDLYGNLDKSVCIQRCRNNQVTDGETSTHDNSKNDYGVLFYILNFQTKEAAIQWIQFLKSNLGTLKIPKYVSIRIPKILLSFKLMLDAETLVFLNATEVKEITYLNLLKSKTGYKLIQLPLVRYIHLLLKDQAEKNTTLNSLITKRNKNSINGFDFKFYDRLEWIEEKAFKLISNYHSLGNQFVLEYRTFPSFVMSNTNEQVEPYPTEGLAINFQVFPEIKNSVIPNIAINPTYITTSDNLLFLIPLADATFPRTIEQYLIEEIIYSNNDSVLKKSSDTFFLQNPYTLTRDDYITWINSDDEHDDYKTHNKYAEDCYKRRVSQILKANCVLDMTEIQKIYLSSADDVFQSEKCVKSLLTTSNFLWDLNNNKLLQGSFFNIVTTSKASHRFLVSNTEVARHWVERVTNLMTYWKLKCAKEASNILDLKTQNIADLNISELENSNINSETSNWIVNRGSTNSEVFSPVSFTLSRPILSRGYLSLKIKKHSQFIKNYAILVPGYIIMYKCFERSKRGYPKNATNQLRYRHLAIPLKNCYIYSGNAMECNMLQNEKHCVNVGLGRSDLPRIYGDGLKSFENEYLRSFTIFFGSSKFDTEIDKKTEKTVNRELSKKIYQENLSTLNRKDCKVSQPNKKVCLLARSRLERDVWVLAIQHELERLNS